MRFNPIGIEFAAVVEGIDLCAPLNSAQVATIHAGMDRHAVLVFHEQQLTDEQQIAFTRSLGKIELNTANNITRLDHRRLSIEMSDISNLDQHSNILAPARVQSRQPAVAFGFFIQGGIREILAVVRSYHSVRWRQYRVC
jgi:alpha-ketoglutarate-dependent taurine dioxygenase